ncbi:MAG: TolC family protein [Desulfobacterales bacterium]|nr:TolC family protein [Desulfobacterales bacterium]
MPYSTLPRCLAIIVMVAGLWGAPASLWAQATPDTLTLSATVEAALGANLDLKSAEEGVRSAQAARDAQKTYFYPAFNTAYQYTRFYEKKTSAFLGTTVPKNEYVWSASVTQPVFTGFALLNRYRMAELGLDLAGVMKQIARQDVILAAKRAYFAVLKAEKLVSVAQEAVTLLTAFRKVAKDFHEVGMTPLNELLKADVELANTRQELTVAQNNLALARSNFNTLLRRPLHDPVRVEDVLDHAPLGLTVDRCLAEALENRREIAASELEVGIGEKDLALARKDYYPKVSLGGNYYRLGTDPDVNGGDGISDPDSWEIVASASWDFWQWGRTGHGVREKAGRLNQARYRRQDIEDQIRLSVEQAFLKTREAETNIEMVRTAIGQARENYRINEEQYKEQVATSTDVLNARTLLSKTMTNYYNALYDFKTAKASLYRAMGRESAE